MHVFPLYLQWFGDGGGKGNRTPDLLNAIQALYQLSYTPTRKAQVYNPSILNKSTPLSRQILASLFFQRVSFRPMSIRPRNQLPFVWPNPPFHLVLVEPDIPQNTGNIARLCAATGSVLNLIEPLGFQLTNKAVKRAGLDYWNAVEIHRFSSLKTLLNQVPDAKKKFFSTSGRKKYNEAVYRPNDYLLFGSESRGLPMELLESHSNEVYNIPIQLDHVRSLNLSNAVSIVLYEALRQCNQNDFLE